MPEIRERHILGLLILAVYFVPVFDIHATSGTIAYLKQTFGDVTLLYQCLFLISGVFLLLFDLRAGWMAVACLPQFFYTYLALDYWLHYSTAPWLSFISHGGFSIFCCYLIYLRYYNLIVFPMPHFPELDATEEDRRNLR